MNIGSERKIEFDSTRSSAEWTKYVVEFFNMDEVYNELFKKVCGLYCTRAKNSVMLVDYIFCDIPTRQGMPRQTNLILHWLNKKGNKMFQISDLVR